MAKLWVASSKGHLEEERKQQSSFRILSTFCFATKFWGWNCVLFWITYFVLLNLFKVVDILSIRWHLASIWRILFSVSLIFSRDLREELRVRSGCNYYFNEFTKCLKYCFKSNVAHFPSRLFWGLRLSVSLKQYFPFYRIRILYRLIAEISACFSLNWNCSWNAVTCYRESLCWLLCYT